MGLRRVLGERGFRLDNLLPTARFKQLLYEHLSGQESLLAQFCVEFTSSIADLSLAMADGVQVYYTYDQHWTPHGHQVIAEAVNRQLAAPTQSNRLQSSP